MSVTSGIIDPIIFIVFFALNIIVGLRYRGKSKSFKEYAIGDKKFSTATLTATIVATWMSGSGFFSTLERTYSTGLLFIIANILGFGGGLLIIGYVIAPRMGRFLNNVSVAEVLGELYGKLVQFISGISTTFLDIGYLAVQFKVISKTLEFLFHYEGPWVTVISAVIIILYSASGGVQAVTFTDVLQFFTFGTLLPVLALVIWHNLEDSSQVAHVLNTSPLFSFREAVKWSPKLMSAIALMIYLMMPGLPPSLFQRIVMAKDTTQIKKSFIYSTILCIAIKLCIIWIAILILADKPGLESKQVIPYIVKHYTYTGLKGFLCVGVIALTMSTADSILNSCAVVIANDVLPPIIKKQEGSLAVAKVATWVVGILSLLLALKDLDILDTILLAANFYLPIVVVPILLAIFGFQTSKRVVLMAIGAGFVTVVACLTYFKSVNSFFPGMFANLVVMLGAHYLLGEEGGWGHNPIEKVETTSLQKSWKDWLSLARKFKCYPYLERILPVQAHLYILFGFYVLTASYASFYILPSAVALQYPGLYKTLQYSVALLITIFLASPIWPKAFRAKNFLVWFWPISIFHALFLVGGMLVIMSGFATPQMLLFMLNFVMAVLLLHWPLTIGMATGGVLLATFIFKQSTGLANLPGDFGNLHFKLTYGTLLCSSFLIALFKYNQAYRNLEERNTWLNTERRSNREELFKALHHEEQFFTEVATEGKDILEAVTKKVEQFKEQASQVHSPEQLSTANQSLQEVHTTLQNTMEYLRSVAYRVQDYLRLEAENIKLESILTKVLEIVKTISLPPKPSILIRNLLQGQEIQCDITKIQQLLVNGLLYAQSNNPSLKHILLDIQGTRLSYPLSSLRDHIKNIAAICITITTETKAADASRLYIGTVGRAPFRLPPTIEELGLSDNLQIVGAHYGAVELQEHDATLIQRYVIPLRLREVRPKVMDIPQMEVGNYIEALQEVRPEETVLLNLIQNKTNTDVELVKKAIDTIKKYHAPVKRKSGEPFYLHPIAATDILLTYTEDPEAILATLLHDTVEDTALTLAEIGVIFGPGVAAIVNRVTSLDDQFQRVNMNAYENLQKLLEGQDVRVLQVKLADRLHNMRTIEGHASLIKQKQVATETQQFFVPIARYLGLKQVEEELQELITAVMKKE